MKTFTAAGFITLILMFCLAAHGDCLTIAVPDKIKVILIEDADSITLAIKNPYKITTIETGQTLKQGDIIWQAEITSAENGINFKTYKNEIFKIYGFNIIPQKEPSIYLGKNLYRGTLQIIKNKNGKLSAINVLNIEDYIKGVLYHEISNTWPIEAIKAQAIASRTFAVYQARERFNKDYFLYACVKSQVYRGVFAEKFRTNKAVDETKGQILVYKNKVLEAFFHAVCGGKTENASNLWKVSVKPLSGVKCGFCDNSPSYNWEKTIAITEIENALNGYKGYAGRIKSIKVLKKNSSGRAGTIRINADKTITVSAKDFRNAIGPKELKSTNFTVSIKNNKAYFIGRGWGHGVGMCQWGAFAMAKKGYNYREILKHYYPGARIITLQK